MTAKIKRSEWGDEKTRERMTWTQFGKKLHEYSVATREKANGIKHKTNAKGRKRQRNAQKKCRKQTRKREIGK